MWDRISQALYLALVSISSIALLVGGIGVMAIMTISVKERTREIGTRKALGARRREILWQFLLEAVFLTAIGGVLGILLGSAVGIGVHYATGFPISLPWWSFAIGIGFSATVGIVFGLFPAIQASGLDRSRRSTTNSPPALAPRQGSWLACCVGVLGSDSRTAWKCGPAEVNQPELPRVFDTPSPIGLIESVASS